LHRIEWEVSMLFLRSSEGQRFIHRGRVCCPLSDADVDSDTCAGCKWLKEVRQDGDLPFVRCEPRVAPGGRKRFWIRSLGIY